HARALREALPRPHRGSTAGGAAQDRRLLRGRAGGRGRRGGGRARGRPRPRVHERQHARRARARAPPRLHAGGVVMRVATTGITSITELNALPLAVRTNLYLRLIPDALLAIFGIERRALVEADRRVRITAPDDASWGRVELRVAADDRDPV